MESRRRGSSESSHEEGSLRRKKKKHDHRLLDAELKRIEKEKAEDEYDKWNLKEDEFFKRQLIEQSKIRIDARREEPIDYFMRILFVYKRQVKPGDDLNIESMRRPKKIIDRLNKTETESILEKCELYRKIEDQEDFKKFWDHVQTLCQHHLERVTKFELKRRGNMTVQSVVPEEYNENVEAIIQGKSIKELTNLETQAQSFIDSMESNVDVEFWDTVLNRVQVQKAVLCLEALHEKYFEGKLDENQTTSNVVTLKEAPRADPLSPRQVSAKSILNGSKVFSQVDYSARLETLREKAFQIELGVLLKQAEKEIELRRARQTQFNKEAEDSDDEDGNTPQDEGFLFKELLKNDKKVDPEEEWLFDEFDSKKKETEWIDKFKPRKPHYFNRVKMGYEWNKVNQAHYDLDTPPPKDILGYKFNIFYPNLLDKTKIPSYELLPTNDPEFCIIRFTAGPPYEDLAFKIANKEWDCADRHSMKCIFERGNLHLHFNFKIARYRR